MGGGQKAAVLTQTFQAPKSVSWLRCGCGFLFFQRVWVTFFQVGLTSERSLLQSYCASWSWRLRHLLCIFCEADSLKPKFCQTVSGRRSIGMVQSDVRSCIMRSQRRLLSKLPGDVVETWCYQTAAALKEAEGSRASSTFRDKFFHFRKEPVFCRRDWLHTVTLVTRSSCLFSDCFLLYWAYPMLEAFVYHEGSQFFLQELCVWKVVLLMH